MVTATTLPKPEAPERATPIIKRSGAVAQAEPAPYRFTADQVLRMSELGIFHPEERLELIEGEIVYMVPPGPLHNSASIRVDRVLQRLLGDDQASVAANISIQVGERSIPMPDVALLKPRADDYETGLPTPEDILLVIEVSHSTLRMDRTRKLVLYAEAEIPAYWIFNVRRPSNRSPFRPS